MSFVKRRFGISPRPDAVFCPVGSPRWPSVCMHVTIETTSTPCNTSSSLMDGFNFYLLLYCMFFFFLTLEPAVDESHATPETSNVTSSQRTEPSPLNQSKGISITHTVSHGKKIALECIWILKITRFVYRINVPTTQHSEWPLIGVYAVKELKTKFFLNLFVICYFEIQFNNAIIQLYNNI